MPEHYERLRTGARLVLVCICSVSGFSGAVLTARADRVAATETEPEPPPAVSVPKASEPEPPPAVSVPKTSEPEPLPAVSVPKTSELDLFKLEAALNELVVTASGGSSEEKSLASADVFTVTREEIRSLGWRSISEVLGNVPGLYLIDDLTLPSVAVRGVSGGLNAGTRIVKVMIDGAAVDFRPDLTAFLGPEFIPIEVVERVEIAKGPLSALYGANAFLATVNIITRKGNEGISVGLGQRLSGIRGKGGFGGSAFLSYRNKSFWILGAISVDRIDRSDLALEVTHPQAKPDSPIFTRTSRDDVATPVSAYLDLGMTTEKIGTLRLQSGVQRLHSGNEFRLNAVLGHQSTTSLLNLWTSLRHEKMWSKGGLSTQIGYSYGQSDSDYSIGLTDNPRYSFHPNVDYHAINAQVAGTYNPFQDRLSVRLGLDLEFARSTALYYTQIFHQAELTRQPGDVVDLISPLEDPHINSYDVGVFLHLASTPILKLPGLRLTGDVRVDKIALGSAVYDPQVSWRAAIAYRFTSHVNGKIFAGRAFQTPSTNLLFGHPGFGNRYNVIGNFDTSGVPRLVPQVLDSVEAACSVGLFDHLLLDGGVYFQNLDRKIEFQQTGSDFVATNQGRAASVGFELQARFTYGRFAASGWGSFLWNIATAPAAGNAPVLNPPPLYPTGIGVVALDLDVPEAYLHVNARGRVVGPRGSSQSNTALNNSIPYELTTYGTVDLTLSTTKLHPRGPDSELTVLFSLRNIADARFSDPGFGGFDMPTIGRTLFLEAREVF